MKKRQLRDNLLEKKREWLDHRYDPGHYTGGNIHPVFEGRRPNKYGYVLIAAGSIGLLITIYAVAHTPLSGRLGLLPGIAVALLAIAAGFKLIRKATRKRGSN